MIGAHILRSVDPLPHLKAHQAACDGIIILIVHNTQQLTGFSSSRQPRDTQRNAVRSTCCSKNQ